MLVRRARPGRAVTEPTAHRRRAGCGSCHRAAGAARAAAHRPVRREIDEQTVVGEVYMRSLVRAQLRLALRRAASSSPSCSAACRCCSRCSRSSPRCDVLGLPLPWLLLGVARLPRRWSWPRGSTSGRPSATSATSPSWCSRRRDVSGSAYGVVAVAVVIAATVLIGTFALRLSRTTSDFYVASRVGVAGVERVGDRRRVPVGGVVPRRRRADPRLRRRHALVPGRLHRGLPRAAGAGRRAAAPLRRVHAAGLRRGAHRVAVACAGSRASWS